MRINRRHSASARPGFGWPLLLALAATAPLVAQIQQGFRGTAWKFPEYHETPLPGPKRTYPLKSLISGEQGRHLSNDLYLVTGMRLEQYAWEGPTNLVARAPECFFKADTRVAWSTGRLEIVGMGGRLTVEGNDGFQATMTNATLIISNRVRTVIERNPLSEYKP
jgi:hypothetical protein